MTGTHGSELISRTGKSSSPSGLLAPMALITPIQRELECIALELWKHPNIQQALAKAKMLMLVGYGNSIPKYAKARFDTALDEYAFSYIERVLCRDRNNSCIHYTCHPPYRRSDGSWVRGSRFYGENPDAVYRWAGIHPDRQQRLVCRQVGPQTATASFSLVSSYGGTTPGATMTLDDIERSVAGDFVITVDTCPADGRPNHLQCTDRTRLLLVREFLGNWEAEMPLDISLEVTGAVPNGSWDLDAAVEEICYFIVEEIYLYFWMNQMYVNMKSNSLRGPVNASLAGGSKSMATCQGYFRLEKDEAAVLRWDPAGARFSALSALDWWFQPIEAHRTQSSLNAATATREADGTVIAVLSGRDPGIANWIDTSGLRDIFLTGRWEGLSDDAPAIGANVVRLDELDAQIPSGTVRLSPDERSTSNARRLAAYTRRTGDLDSQFDPFAQLSPM